jgi:hypothetical protein
MKLLVLLLILIQSISAQNDFLSNETLHYLNELKYSQESKIRGDDAEFRFTVFNTSYARNVLGIDSYYFSITYVSEESREVRLPPMELSTNTTKYQGILKMESLEEDANYFVCVFFLNQTNLIGSSRFCYVVSVSNRCQLVEAERSFDAIYIYILLGFVGVLLAIIVIFSTIRRFVYRPRTIEDYLNIVPQHHREYLENLAPSADDRRRRRTQADLDKRLREDSVPAISYNHNPDQNYYNYHGIDNASFETLTE